MYEQRLFRRFVNRLDHMDRQLGASMVEYALLVALIALIAFAAVQLAGDTLSDTYSTIANSLVKANTR